tara:strand:+ start:148 stop:396 length:249 start_codon:yes stop_codon:yes gene_type:complete
MTTDDDTINIYGVGTTVCLTEKLEAKIITVAIHSENTVMYECAWWNGDSRTKDWFSADDFVSIGEKKADVKIGFRFTLAEEI